MSYNFSGSSTSKSSYHQQVTTPSSGFWLKPSIREPLGKTTKLVVLGLISLVLGSQRALALPTGGQVASGTATIGQPDATHMNINQTTDRAVINWQEFNIGSQEGVTFIQPSATSATLNRVTGSTPSDIAGSINANGQIMLVNPNGILFQNTANVDVSGLVATTLNISDTNFLSGLLPNQATSPAWSFSTSSGKTPATVENQGNITIRNSGFAALVAPTVTNSGTINALLGKVVLGSGTAATVDFRGDRLISLAVTPGLKTSVSNSGNLIADGGVVKLSARSGAAVLDNVINTTGLIQAQSANNQNGKIVLEGGNNGTVTVAGSLNAAGRVDVTGKTVQVSTGNITAPNAKFTAQGDLTFNQNYTSGGGNLELLTTGTGNISTQKISTQGGTLSINSKNSINTNGADLDSTNGASNGGKITLLANNNITTGSILSLSRNDAGNAGNGGIVSATATNGNITTGNIDSSSSSPVGTTGAGGNVTLTAKGSSGGDINVQGISSGSFASSTAGIGGNVSLTAANTINIGNINNVANTKNNYGNISLTGNEINLNGGDNSIRGDGKTVLMQSSSPGQKIRIGSSDTNATDTLDLTSTDVAALKDGFSNITIGRTNGSGAVTIDPVTFFDPVKIQATGVGGTILANGTISGASGSNSSISLLANGNINTQGIKTYGNTINILSNNGGITTNGQALDTTNGASNGGAMTLTAKNGDINTGNLNTSSTNIDGNAGKGGSIALTATGSSGGNININGSVSTGAYASGNVGYGGNVTFKANNSLTLGSVNQGFASNFSNGSVILQASNIYLNPGATTIFGDSITATGPITAANAPNSSITLGASRNISTQAIRTYGNALTMASLKGSITTNNQHLNTTNGASDAGGISLGAYNGISTGNISSNSYLATGSGNVGKGGDINLTNINGNISTGVVNSSSSNNGSGSASNAGNIVFKNTFNGNITTGNINSASNSSDGTASNGGAITLNANNGNITTGNIDSNSKSNSGTAGNGGAIALTATNGSIQTGNLTSASVSLFNGNSGTGGNITLSAGNNITTTDISSASVAGSGTPGNGGAIALTATNGSIQTGTLTSASASLSNSNAGNGGAIALSAGNNITLNGNIDTTGGLSSGNLSFSGTTILLTDDLAFNTNSTTGTDGNVDFGSSVLDSNVAGTGRTLDIYKGTGSVNPNPPSKTTDVTVNQY